MASEQAKVKALGWSPYLGKTDTLVSLTILGRHPVKVQDFWVDATLAFETVLIATGYENPCDYIGSYLKRYIKGTTIWSWHSYGGAIDLDYGGNNPESPEVAGIDRNPDLGSGHGLVPGDPRFGIVCQLTEANVRAVEAIRTKNGKQVWRWIGWEPRGDTMHFEPACSPDDARTGIDPSTVVGAQEADADMSIIQGALKAQDMEFYVELQAKTGTPGGNAAYWGKDYTGAKPSQSEWDDATPALFEAVVKVAGLPCSAAGTVDAYTKAQADAKYVLKGTKVTSVGTVS